MTDRKYPWSIGNCNGLWVDVVHDKGRVVKAATPDAARDLCLLLNDLETSSAFGQQCYQDHCENAYVEASVVKLIERRLAFALRHLGNVQVTVGDETKPLREWCG